jgi:hypothetical protein
MARPIDEQRFDGDTIMTTTEDDLDLGWDFEITKMRRRDVGGTWVIGRTNDHRFEALVFPDHAEIPEYEIDQSRISKLWLSRIADRKMVYNFDRGLDVAPADPTAAAIVGFLTSGLADLV